MMIRSAIPEDIPLLEAVACNAATAAHWSPEQYQQIFDQHGVKRVALVAEESGQIEGFLVGRAAGEEWEVENAVVARAARRRGLASRLIGEFLALARGHGAHAVFLEVRESNHAARALYENSGFKELGRRKGYYRDPLEDAVVYRLSLA